MSENIESKSETLQKFQTPDMKIPVIFHASKKLLPNEYTFSQLENLGKNEKIFSHIAAVSDVHPKKGRKNPTGTIVASRNHIFPQINDTAPNCGMRFLKTNLNEENFSAEKIDELFNELVKVIPTKKFIGTKIPFSLVMNIAKKGVKPITEYFDTHTKNEIENTYQNGNIVEKKDITNKDIFNVIPKLFLYTGKYRLGILGAAGNHFLDLMKITDIKNNEIAEKFNLKKGQYIFLLHTGSGLLGQYASYMYTPKVKEHLSQKIMLAIGTALFKTPFKKEYKKLQKKIKEYQDKNDFFSYDENSTTGKMFTLAHQVAANFGVANRSIITHNLDNALEKIVGKKIDLELLYDMPHILNIKEHHLGETVWVHRNGTSRANGPKRMQNHPLFSQTGEPVFIPSSMSTPAYLGVGTNENVSSFFSASHGTGRRAKTEGNLAKNKKDLLNHMDKACVKLYNAKSKGVILQDSGYYKDIEEVIKGMESNKMIKSVVKMQPIAVLMY